ncbi:MAG: glycoside hydrolase family 13 protein [Clostridia bacterium]|nr:glycoside hydrolase family 13 protein [Clostridia bacterium]
MEKIRHLPNKIIYRNPAAAPAAGISLELKADFSRRLAAKAYNLYVWPDEGRAQLYPLAWEGLADGFDRCGCRLCLKQAGLYWYRFEAVSITNEVVAASDQYQLTCYEPDFVTPNWLGGGICYHIFVDRFCRVESDGEPYPNRMRSDWGGIPEYLPDQAGIVRNDDFFGGNLRGIISKLDYLQSLSVNCLYLSPIFRAASNHKYDTGDFRQIDPAFGTFEDFQQLAAEADKRGIRLLLDGVFSHTGDDSRYFNKYGNYSDLGAYQSPNSPYYQWYKFNHYPDDYDCWWGIKTLPEVDEDNLNYRDFICGEQGVVRYWLRNGAGGFRLDVADELTDGFLEALRRAVKSEKPDALLIGEVWEEASTKKAYGQRRHYFAGRQLDGVINYPFREAVINYLRSGDCAHLAQTVQQIWNNYPPPVHNCLMNAFASHDTQRLITALAGRQPAADKSVLAVTRLSEQEYARGKELVKIAACLQFFLPGFPCIYYGEEIGMEGYGDPFCRRCYPWGTEDQDLLAHYRTLGKIRRKADFLARADFRILYAEGGVFVFARTCGEKALVCAVNCGSEPVDLIMEEAFFDCFSGEEIAGILSITENNYKIAVGMTEKEVQQWAIVNNTKNG